MRERAGVRSAAITLAGQDIAPLPPVRDPDRRVNAEADLRFFCEAYFPHVFTLPWSDDHIRIIAKMQRVIVAGEVLALAMPRAGGKTTISLSAVLWAVLSGRHRFVFLIAASEERAEELLENLKNRIRSNVGLLDDFPEAIYPFRVLEGEARRSVGQRYYGVPTRIEWTDEYIVFPTIPQSLSSGAIIRVSGLSGSIRGALYVRPDGQEVRPSLFMCDDPQTDATARSWSQCEVRERLLCQAFLGLGGPQTPVAGLVLCTVIRANDLADRLVDREQHPEFQGERTKMVYQFPKNEKRWIEYGRIRAESLRQDHSGREATEYYVKHREEMDRGAVVAWPALHDPDEISAVQHAMNLKLKNEAGFWAEYQNQPILETEQAPSGLTAADVAGKINGRPHRQVPQGCEHITAFVDVGEKALFYAVCAWESQFTGYVIDYGSHPDQRRAYYTTYDLQRTLRRTYPGTGVDGAIYSGLEALVSALCAQEWRREDGALMHVELLFIDQGWKPDVVHQFCRQSRHAATLMPSRGYGVTASQKPFTEYSKGKGDRIGHFWWIPAVRGRRTIRHVEIDTNFWKSFIHRGFQTAMGDKGCVSLWGNDPNHHQLFGEHLTAEYFVVTQGRGRTLEEWKLRTQKPDNHWFDCIVGCAAAASMRGIVSLGPGGTEGVGGERRRTSLAALYAERHRQKTVGAA